MIKVDSSHFGPVWGVGGGGGERAAATASSRVRTRAFPSPLFHPVFTSLVCIFIIIIITTPSSLPYKRERRKNKTLCMTRNGARGRGGCPSSDGSGSSSSRGAVRCSRECQNKETEEIERGHVAWLLGRSVFLSCLSASPPPPHKDLTKVHERQRGASEQATNKDKTEKERKGRKKRIYETKERPLTCYFPLFPFALQTSAGRSSRRIPPPLPPIYEKYVHTSMPPPFRIAEGRGEGGKPRRAHSRKGTSARHAAPFHRNTHTCLPSKPLTAF